MGKHAFLAGKNSRKNKLMVVLLMNHRRGRVKWGFVCYTMVMFSCATVATGLVQNVISISTIDNREFPGIEGVLSPGPDGYWSFIYSTPTCTVPNFASLLSYWLADGLLVGCSILHPPVRVSNAVPTPAPSLLRNLRQEPLDHRLPLPRVPCLCGCVFEFSANRR